MPVFHAVLFDFFGTLTRPVQRGTAHRLTAELLGCPVEALAAVLDRSYYERASGRFGTAEATMRWVCEQAGVHPPESTLRAAVASRYRAVRADTRLRDEAVPVLAGLRRRGVRTGLISDCTHELPAFLPELAVAPLLDVRVFSVRVGRCKPDPALYLAACGRLGLAPADCLYVGDGGSRELTGAERAGMTAVRLAAPDLAEHMVFDAEPAWDGPVLHSLDEVLDVVGHDTVPAGCP
ncbi:HAD family hydrolase [Micromonospora olivasterospora]|uniref:Putative hydrolase of the HAD superfamily n=1 Tax=Micromonospora olivasterospora TaxID=1880 RepID=A0A562IB10_MICOL|nr:HAD family hydrolase [Micromonospora olivasterospora]TWH68209.1 putative hydrolase of the HAD superfamily [Micromonospora olivasterospora]